MPDAVARNSPMQFALDMVEQLPDPAKWGGEDHAQMIMQSASRLFQERFGTSFADVEAGECSGES